MDVLRVLKGLGMAILCLLLVWGLREQLHDAIDKCLVPIFGFKGNDALSLFFAVVTTTLAVIGVERFVVKSKVVSMRDAFCFCWLLGYTVSFGAWMGITRLKDIGEVVLHIRMGLR